MGKKTAPPDAELDADGLVIQRYRSMVLVVVPRTEFGEECLRYARASLYNVHVGTKVVSLSEEDPVQGRLQDTFLVDGTASGEAMASYSGLVLAGGEGALELARDPDVLRLVREAAQAGKLLGAWGHSVALLAATGVLKGRRVTCHPAVRDSVKQAGARLTTRQVEVDGNLVTASDEAAGMRFGKALAALVGI
jgi:putative intracellular protease/amidase